MAKAVSPSEILSAGQIIKLTDLLSAGLRKAELPCDVSQQVIENQGSAIVKEFVAGFRQRVEAISKLIVRLVKKVNRTRTPQEALRATGRTLHINDIVVATMPMGHGEGAEIVFLKPEPEEYTRPGFMSDDDLEKALECRDLISVDPNSLAAFNEANPTFADERPHGTHWKDADGKWCYAAFNLWFDGERRVRVGRDDDDWDDDWFFAGVRKSLVLAPKA